MLIHNIGEGSLSLWRFFARLVVEKSSPNEVFVSIL
jgi:hypothetical protein